MESNQQLYTDNVSVNSDTSQTDIFIPAADPRNERLKAIEDIRKKFKCQHNGSFKTITVKKAENLDVNQSNEIDTQSQLLMKKNERFQDLYEVLDTIGQGSLAVVKKVRKNDTNDIYAAKIIRTRDPEHLDQLRNEFQILAKCEHKNIIKARDLLVDTISSTAQLILDYFPSKTLAELIAENKRIEEKIMRGITEQLSSAIKYLHEKGICHRDIKPSNILVNTDNEVKIIDFSASKIFKNPTIKKMNSIRKSSSPLVPSYPGMMLTDTGTPAYKAPEIINGIPYNQSVDMWAVGVVTFYALAGYKPFQSKYIESLYKKINAANYKWDPLIWKDVSGEAALFVKSCLKKFPFVRLRAVEALHHPWVKGIKLDLCKIQEKPFKRSSSTQADKTKMIDGLDKLRTSSLASTTIM